MSEVESVIERAVASEQEAYDFYMGLDIFVFSTDSRRPALRQLKGGRGILGAEVGEAMN
ncbi:MAG: hypothetical protein LLG93_07370 [Deltaproteobacteria bacterium]|nr:hypothetical protein [Deltaproteobacteria bacterium]